MDGLDDMSELYLSLCAFVMNLLKTPSGGSLNHMFLLNGNKNMKEVIFLTDYNVSELLDSSASERL